MEGSLARKFGRLAGDLTRHPRYIPRYVTHLRRTPLDLGLPWFSYEAIEFLAAHVRPEMTVFEYGAGGSTAFFAQLGVRVTSIEPDPTWRQRVRNAMAGWCTVELRADGEIDRPHDVVVIDHADPPWNPYGTRSRAETFRLVEPLMRRGGIVVLDDSWRHSALRAGRRVRVCQSVGPCRVGVTTTDIFFY